MEDLKPIRGDSQQTEGLRECIRRLVDEKIRNQGAANRHRDTHAKSVALVKCGTLRDNVDGLYEGTVRMIRGLDLTYQDQHGPAWLLDANGGALQPDMTYSAIRYGDHTLDGGSSSGGDTRPVYVCQTSGDTGTCALPESAQALADASPQGPDAWVNGGDLLITLSGECCHWAVMEQQCSEDGTHPQFRWNVVYFSQPIKVAIGPWEDTEPPPAWFPDCPTDGGVSG